MVYARRGIPLFLVCLFAVRTVPLFGGNLHPVATSRGMITATRAVQAQAAGIYFSGIFSYSIGGGQAILKADNVTNPNATASGPLRFSLWWTPTPYPAAGGSIVASYDITASLAAGASIAPVNGGNTGVPFTTPASGCYSIALVLEENVGGTWTQRDFANFSLKFDIGGACITSFTANPTTVASGAASTLSWTTGGGSVTSVSIDNGVGSKPATGSAIVNPISTTTYTLSAFTTANSSPPTAQVTVTVGQPAPTATFSAAPTSISTGQSSTLTWSTTNATTISIDNGVGSKPASGSASVSPASTTTYTLTANGPGGTVTRTATVTVTTPAPTVSFTAAPASIVPGQSSSLVWTTTNATSVSINNGVGPVALSGSTSVSPNATTSYTLTAVGPGGTQFAFATVTVSGAPSILFSANPTSIKAGESSTLLWAVSNADVILIDQGIGTVTGLQSFRVSPGVTTTYKMTATNSVGTTTATATVTVTAPPAPAKHRAVKH